MDNSSLNSEGVDLESIITVESTSSNTEDSHIERRKSLNSIDSFVEKIKKFESLSPKRHGSLGIPRNHSLDNLREKRKSVLSISRPDPKRLQELEDEDNIKKEWVDDFIRMFIVPEAKLHINDNRAVVTREESVKRIYQLTLTSSFILALVVSVMLTQFDYTSTKLLPKNERGKPMNHGLKINKIHF